MLLRTLVLVAIVSASASVQSPRQQPSPVLPPDQFAAADEKPILALPAADGAWLVQVVTTGGLTGRGFGQNFAISSEGLLGRQGRTETQKIHLSLAVTRPIGDRLSNLEAIAQDAAVPVSVCRDCVRTTLVVWRRGRPAMFQRWDVTTMDKLNPAIVELYRDAMAVMRSASGF